MKKLISQLMKFGIVGILAFVVDYCVMIFLTEACGIHYLASSGCSFIVSVIVNYILSMRYVFKGKEDMSKVREFIIFIILSIIGLGVNQVVMWLSTDIWHIFYMLSKIAATAIVMIYNFISRKLILEQKQPLTK